MHMMRARLLVVCKMRLRGIDCERAVCMNASMYCKQIRLNYANVYEVSINL